MYNHLIPINYKYIHGTRYDLEFSSIPSTISNNQRHQKRRKNEKSKLTISFLIVFNVVCNKLTLRMYPVIRSVGSNPINTLLPISYGTIKKTNVIDRNKFPSKGANANEIDNKTVTKGMT